jgi:hypothetical protein
MSEPKYERKYLAIGHWMESNVRSSNFNSEPSQGESSENVTCISAFGLSIRDFRGTLSANGFVPYVVMTEERFNHLKNMDSFDIFETVKKMTTNYRVWDVVTEYIEQCADIMEEKLSRV